MKKRLGTIPKGLEWIAQESLPSSMKISATKTSSDEVMLSSAKRGLPEDLTRATFIMKQEYLDKIKAYAYWERLQIKDVLDDMCEQFFKLKKIRSIPKK